MFSSGPDPELSGTMGPSVKASLSSGKTTTPTPAPHTQPMRLHPIQSPPAPAPLSSTKPILPPAPSGPHGKRKNTHRGQVRGPMASLHLNNPHISPSTHITQPRHTSPVSRTPA